MGGREAMLATVRAQLGYRERADGSTKYGDWYAARVHDGAYRAGDWCDMGLSWSAVTSGNEDAFGVFAYVPSHMNWFRARGQFGRTPQVGAAVFFDWNANGEPNHIGIVESINGSTVHTIEFNHNNRCERVVRSVPSLILGYGYPAYAAGADDDGLVAVVSVGA